MSTHVERTIRHGDTGLYGRVYSLSYSHAAAWNEQKWCDFWTLRLGRCILMNTFQDLNLLVGQLSGKQKVSNAIKHALEVQRALSTNNYHAFFELYSNAPNMGAYIMDHFVDRERTKALMIMSKAYVAPFSGLIAFELIASICIASFQQISSAAANIYT